MHLAEKTDSAFSIRYPRGRGNLKNYNGEYREIELGKSELIKVGSELAILCIGTTINNVLESIEDFEDSKKSKIGVYNMLFIKPLDSEALEYVFKNYKTIVTVEDGQLAGGFGSSILEWSAKRNYKNHIKLLGVEDKFVEHGKLSELHELTGLSTNRIKKSIEEILML